MSHRYRDGSYRVLYGFWRYRVFRILLWLFTLFNILALDGLYEMEQRQKVHYIHSEDVCLS